MPVTNTNFNQIIKEEMFLLMSTITKNFLQIDLTKEIEVIIIRHLAAMFLIERNLNNLNKKTNSSKKRTVS